MAGGITLLAVMLLFMDPLEAIPLHAIVQMVFQRVKKHHPSKTYSVENHLAFSSAAHSVGMVES